MSPYFAALRFVRDYLRRRFTHFKLRAHLLDLRCLLFLLGRELRCLFFQLRSESLYLLLLPRDGCLQLLNFVIEHGLLGGFGNGLARGGLGRKSTRVGSSGSDEDRA